MDLSTVLTHQVRALLDGLGTGDDTLTDTLAVLAENLDTAVSAYLGLRLTLVADGCPVTLTAFPSLNGHRPVTSLRLALSGLGPGFDPASRIVFYAGIPGTFVDLAADLTYRLGTSPAVALDVELPPPTVVSGFIGLTEFATVNRAVGVLLARGQNVSQARSALQHGASAAGMDLAGYAARLLGE